ncbi:MAG TPA: beta-galactosidase [Ktedonobacteraceae bacterium]|nr:beta-galactosidase [Ktedonobacteraceae bacterium]
MRKFKNKGRAILTVGVICLLLVAVIVGVGANIISRNGGKTKSLSATATATPPTYPNFKGLYQFTSSNTSKNSNNPYLAGTHLGFYWSQLEPQKGVYDWSAIDKAMQPWTNNGKKIILRVSTSGYTSWYRPYSGNGTPEWVYKLGVSSVTETDGSILPQYWNPIFLSNLKVFMHAFALRYDGNPNVAYIDVSLGIGGEAKADSHNSNPNQLNLWHSIGYTNALWWGAIQQIMAIYQSSFSKTPLAVMPDKVFMEQSNGYTAALLLNYAVKHGLWLQDNGLAAGRTLPSQYMLVPHPEEQIAATSQTHDTLKSDIQSALNLGGNYILLFSTDTLNPANQATLKWAASKVAH